MSLAIDHLVVGVADLSRGVEWIAALLGTRPVAGGTHEGFGTRNALLGLGPQYLEVLAIDPQQPAATSSFRRLIEQLEAPRLVTVAVAKSPLARPVPMSRVRPDGGRMEWALEFTSTPLFFIDWLDCPRPSGLPDAGRITELMVTTPEPDALADLAGVTVVDGSWEVRASVNGIPLR